jgi:hypothetical protein
MNRDQKRAAIALTAALLAAAIHATQPSLNTAQAPTKPAEHDTGRHTEMTLLSPKVEIELDGEWTDITTYVRTDPGVQIQRGRQNEQGNISASTLTMALNNSDGRFSPRNPNGAYYGTLGRNTPVRVSVAGDDRFHGEISEWPPRWDLSENNQWVNVQASGVTRRLVQGPKPLLGPIQRMTLASTGIEAYWPMTDGTGATSFASGLPGKRALTITGTPDLASSDVFVSSDPLPQIAEATYSADIDPYTATSTIYIRCLLAVPSGGDGTGGTVMRLYTTGTAARWDLNSTTGGSLTLHAYDNALPENEILNDGATFGINGRPVIAIVELVQNGSNIDWRILTIDAADGTGLSWTGTLNSYTIGTATRVQVNPTGALDTTVVGHLTVASAGQGDVDAALLGHVGETAGRRIERLCDEEGIDFDNVGDLDDTEPMGAQTPKTLVELLTEAEAADGGYLYEPKTALGYAYRTRTSMYTTSADLTVAYTSLAELEPVEDDQGIRNDVTINRIGGSSARHEITTGPLSTQAPPNGVGRYQVAQDLSLEQDSQCGPIAQWKAGLGTLDEPRYPTISVDLRPLTTNKADAVALDIGDTIEVTSPPLGVGPSGIQALVLGYTETITPVRWLLDLNCASASVWAAPFTLDDTTFGQLTSDTTVTSEALDTTETGVDYTGDTWVTTATNPDAFPFDILIGGEQMTVTAATSSTLTVTRSVNGVVKSHDSGTAISPYRPGRLML